MLSRIAIHSKANKIVTLLPDSFTITGQRRSSCRPHIVLEVAPIIARGDGLRGAMQMGFVSVVFVLHLDGNIFGFRNGAADPGRKFVVKCVWLEQAGDCRSDISAVSSPLFNFKLAGIVCCDFVVRRGWR